MNKVLLFPPVVFATGNEYQIFARVSVKCTFSIEVNGKKYFDDSNGILRSETYIHSVQIPMQELDTAGEYTVCTQTVIKRLPYRTPCRKPVISTFSFKPVPVAGEINIYHIADTHGRVAPAVTSARNTGKPLDLLILNGDIIDASFSEKEFDVIYDLCGQLTNGGIPVIFSRGNHDLRGKAAEFLENYIPTVNGKTYYTFRLGRIWGIVLDCGEDKPDAHEEYGNMICCEAFRREETEFIKTVIKNSVDEYESPGIEYRLVIAHNPFCYTIEPPFDIEQDTYKEWASLLKTKIKPLLMLCGHMHVNAVSEIGGEYDSLGQPCTVVIGSEPSNKRLEESRFSGCALTLNNSGYDFRFI